MTTKMAEQRAWHDLSWEDRYVRFYALLQKHQLTYHLVIHGEVPDGAEEDFASVGFHIARQPVVWTLHPDKPAKEAQ